MKLNKILKVISVIFECAFAGGVILYGYNYYIGTKKYDIIPEALQKNLNTFVIIAIVAAIVAIIIRFVLYMRTHEKQDETVKEERRQTQVEERDYSKSIEAPVTERVIIYKDSYEIPKENRMACPNCNSIIDKNAFLCLKCGFLLRPVIEKRIIKSNNNNSESISKSALINILVNTGLIIAIIVCLLLIINIAMERGIIG